MTGTDFVLIALICGYFTSIVRQAWLSTRIDDLNQDNYRLRRDLEYDVETLETQIAREAGNRRSTCAQWHREVNTRLWTLERQHATTADEDLDVPDTDTHPIPDKEHTPCPTTSASTTASTTESATDSSSTVASAPS